MADEQTPPVEGTEAPQAPPTPNPWDRWQEAGWDSSQNPYELREQHSFTQRLLNEQTHEQALNDALREWGHLPEGVSLQDFKAWATQQAQARQDPFGMQPQQPQQPQYPGVPQQQPEYVDPYGQPQQNYLDPAQLRQGVESILEQRLAQERQNFEQQMAVQRLQDDLSRQFERVSSQHGLSEVDRTMMSREVDRRIRAGEVQSQEQLSGIAEAVWKELHDWRTQAVAQAVQAQQGAPRTMTPTGATPGNLPPPVGLDGAFARARAIAGMGPDQ